MIHYRPLEHKTRHSCKRRKVTAPRLRICTKTHGQKLYLSIITNCCFFEAQFGAENLKFTTQIIFSKHTYHTLDISHWAFHGWQGVFDPQLTVAVRSGYTRYDKFDTIPQFLNEQKQDPKLHFHCSVYHQIEGISHTFMHNLMFNGSSIVSLLLHSFVSKCRMTILWVCLFFVLCFFPF